MTDIAIQEAFETGLVITGIAFVLIAAYFLWSLSPKIIGFVLLLFGLFVLRYFPRMTKYQPHYFTRLGLVIGFGSILIGILLIVFL